MAAAGLALVGLVGYAARAFAAGTAAALGALGLGVAVYLFWRPKHEQQAHAVTLALLAAAGGLAAVREAAGPDAGLAWLPALLAAAFAGGTFWYAMRRLHIRLTWAETQREEVAKQLDRRISELFSLQELSYVLSESIHIERIVEQVARYAARFLQADGALVVLFEGDDRQLRVVAADGSMAPQIERLLGLGGASLVSHAVERDRIEVAQGVAVPSVQLIENVLVRSAAVAPLKAHGVTLGALAVVDRHEGPFTTEDLWLLSTVATQASVVLANGRLFEMVRQSKEEWETAFNALAEGLAVVDPHGRIVRMNRSLARLAEATEDELVGRDLGEALFGEPEATAALVAAARRGERPTPLIQRVEPARRTLRLTAAPLAEGVDRAPVVLLVEDVTEQRALEAQLIQNEKMAAIGQLVSGVAHELNNPLTSIAGLAELLLERGPMGDAPRELLRVIHDQADRASRIVRNLLTFARKGTAEKEAIDLSEVVSRTTLLVSYELKLRGIELETHLAREPVLALSDRYELQQVLLNLVTNAAQALDALPPGRPRAITVETARQGDQAVHRVRDTGPGVPQALVPNLFTPFFTTKGPGHGTGLGLSLSYGLIESHGGRISYAPGEDGGAEFTILLPCHRCDGDEALPEPIAVEEPARGRRILVVDDDPGVHRFVSALFTPEGHTVEVTRNAQNALRLARDATYDLVIADAAIVAGDELFVSALLDHHPAWRDRLVVATASHGPDADALFPGESLYRVPKPFDLRALRALAHEIFGRRAA